MSRKNRKKTSPNRWLKDPFNKLIRLTIVIAIFLGGNDYQITTVIQLNTAAPYELLKLTESQYPSPQS